MEEIWDEEGGEWKDLVLPSASDLILIFKTTSILDVWWNTSGKKLRYLHLLLYLPITNKQE